MSAPKVSIVIPAYNAQHCIEKAIDSVLQQSIQDIEIIVVNDCSTDNTASVVRSLAQKDERVKYFKTAENRGPGHARNLGIERANGEWFTTLDSDDWFESSRLEKLIDAANKLGLSIACDNQKFISAKNGKCIHLLDENGVAQPKILTTEEFFNRDCIDRKSRNLGLFKPLIKRKILSIRNIRYDDIVKLTLGEDFYFLLECLQYEKGLAYVSEPLYNYLVDNKLSLTNRLRIDSYIEWKSMHNRYSLIYDTEKDKTEVELMKQRGFALDKYIEFRKLVEPLKNGQFIYFLRQFAKQPCQSIKLLLGDTLKDPAALVLLGRYVIRNLKQKFINLFNHDHQNKVDLDYKFDVEHGDDEERESTKCP